jgi:hypothetical protein
MSVPKTVHLGFAVGSAAPVEIPIRNMVVTGQTQESGKTTTLEALIARSGVRSIAFVTKRGEGGFSAGRRIPAYFRERADWVFVASLIDATLGEKNKLLRAWLMKVCRGTKTLAEVQKNVRERHKDARGFAESIYEEINGYLDLVVPEIEATPLASKIQIGPGLNVMDLTGYSLALQQLVIRSALEHVYEKETGVITVVPEAWEFIPQGRRSPVKLAAAELVRKGSVLANFLWPDSQDIAGVDKELLRSCPVWLIGVQREANEIKRALSNIPAGIAKPSAADIATLERGQFYACFGRHAIKTYVQPEWMREKTAIAIAGGEQIAVSPPERKPPKPAVVIAPPREKPCEIIPNPIPAAAPAAEEQDEMSQQDVKEIKESIAGLARQLSGLSRLAQIHPPAADTAPNGAAAPADLESLYQHVKRRLLEEAESDPQLVRVLAAAPAIEYEPKEVKAVADGTTLKGRLLTLIAEGFADEPAKANAINKELARRGWAHDVRNTGRAMDSLAEEGFLTIEAEGYLRAPRVKITKTKA